MRGVTQEMLKYYIQNTNLKGKVLEIGGFKLSQCAINFFPPPRFEYYDLNLEKSDIENTIIGDITDAKMIEDNTFDIIFSSDVFEHIKQPWLAAKEIIRILKPGGIVITSTVWSWRNHPCPVDFWRFSPACLDYLFEGIETLESGFDLGARRNDSRGTWENGMDAVPVDEFGGWRENWGVYHIGAKMLPEEQKITPFKQAKWPKTQYVNKNVQGKLETIRQQERAFEKISLEKEVIRLREELEKYKKRDIIFRAKRKLKKIKKSFNF